ncbi:helix-turn-helix domain-containing protein [Pseudoalteromonas aliena]|jgi:transcriptional regulator with XRE-family HTH domain|uniref:HTH cro/C1-type domain-containing protein n=1 Tax=Pseudoalteromonas aliena SW19 TaxID=1314866 RepID=A0ABR9DW56_9GAMM|nr:helix-turn-helix transcriptional regulator [Pseudoalteromonas aliena]MBE0358596.1 hypothetical protein [Pseudoalteromonas aliena SW19]
MSSLGMELKRLRANKKWTQAFAAKEIGIQQSYLSKLENGQSIPSPDVIEKLNVCYHVSIEHFVPNQEKTANLTKKLKWGGILFIIIGILIYLCAMLNIFFPETFFTYQAKNQGFWAINITEIYKGEKYIEGDVIYEIIGQRDVSRIENRILCVSSAVFIFIGILMSVRRVKPLHQKEK